MSTHHTNRLSKKDKRLIKKTICRAFERRNDCRTEQAANELCRAIAAVNRYDAQAKSKPIGLGI